MGLIQDHIVPCFSFKDVGIPTCKRVGGDADVEMVFIVPTLTQLFSTFRIAMVTQSPKTRQEFLEFHLPVQQHTGRDDLEIGT